MSNKKYFSVFLLVIVCILFVACVLPVQASENNINEELINSPDNIILSTEGDSCLLKVQTNEYANDGILWGDIVYIEDCK